MIVNVASMVLATYNSIYQAWIYNYPLILIVLGYITMSVGLLIVFVPGLGRRFPSNWIVLAIFNILTCCFLAGVFCLTDTKSVVTSFGIVISMCIGLTIYTFACGDEYKVCGAFLYAFCGIGGAFVFLTIVFPIRTLTLIAVSPPCLLYSLYLAYDTRLMITNQGHTYQANEYITASVILFWDFLRVLFELFRKCVKSPTDI